MKIKIKIKDRKAKRTFYLLIFLIILLSSQLVAMTVQILRYEKHVYDCSDMSEDCEFFFESLGIPVQTVIAKEKGTNTWHEWLLLDLGFFKVHFESTKLLIQPSFVYKEKYEVFQISDGYIHNNEYVEKRIWALYDI